MTILQSNGYFWVIVCLVEASYHQESSTKERTGKDMANGQHASNMLTVREVAQLLHVHPNTLRRWSNNGRIRRYRITPRGDRRFKPGEIARFLAESNGQGDDGQEAQNTQWSQ